ncbi:MAG: ATP-binding protein [Anaerolineae bacterium]|nr:ATP-binding protein [Anaerolineae bacterium]
MQDAYDLLPFDLDTILIALAPELDLRYERLYAYLQDDVSRKRPSVDLVLNLLSASADEKLVRRSHFAATAPLVSHRLVHLVPDPHQAHTPLLAQSLKLDDQIVRLLLGKPQLDARLAAFSHLVEPWSLLDELPVSADVHTALADAIHQVEDGDLMRLYFHGPPGAGKRWAAEALAAELGMSLLAADLTQALKAPEDFDLILCLILREAWFCDAVLYLSGLDRLRTEDLGAQYDRLLEEVAADGGVTILAGIQPWTPSARRVTGVVPVFFSAPTVPERRSYWELRLAEAGIDVAPADLDDLASRFRLTPGQIDEAVALAAQRTWVGQAGGRRQAASRGKDTIGRLFDAARAQAGHDLMALATKIDPVYVLDDIVLPDDSLDQLDEICQRVRQRHRVFHEWGFDRKLSMGKGINALFAGASGTGKTMAAEILANVLGLDLYKIDLSGVVSKYIGETEKNLDRIFDAAEDANAILLFDEADALFGKRSEVRDSHDRYANIEISYLLQKMEEYDGITILSTNMRQNLDDAFVRRMAFSVHFPFPDEESRQRIWQGIWPSHALLADGVDLDWLALEFRLAGGNIKNIALAAAFMAAEENSQITMGHILRAVRREYQKMGKTLTQAEMDGYTARHQAQAVPLAVA